MADIDRIDADALFTEAMRTEILQVTTRESVALQTIPTVQMSNKKDRLPVVATLPQAEWLAAEGDPKPTTDVTWDNCWLQAEELAVIVPIDDTVLADAQIDVAAQVTDLVAQAFAEKIDSAVFFGTDAPASWPVGGIFGAIDPADLIPYEDPLSWGLLFDHIEVKGKDVSDVWSSRIARTFLRHPIIPDTLSAPLEGLSVNEVHGVQLSYPLGWERDQAMAIAADDSCLILGMRQDMTFDFSNQAYIEGFGSLWQKDATALRAVMRLGFCIANPINVDTGDRSLPLAALTPPAGGYPFSAKNFGDKFKNKA